jgi:hypothetical protein
VHARREAPAPHQHRAVNHDAAVDAPPATSSAAPRAPAGVHPDAPRVETVPALPADNINASVRPARATAIAGELVSRRAASPIAVGFTTFAIVVLLLLGGRRAPRPN